MKMEPRIYTYKITFKGTNFFYFGIHKERRFDEEYWGSPITHKHIWNEYEPQKEILSLFSSWEEGRIAETNLIRSWLDSPECLNESCGGFYSLEIIKEAGRKGGVKTDSKPGHMSKAGKASGAVWTKAKRESSRRNIDKARLIQKEKKLQIYGDWEYHRRKGRLTRFGVVIDGDRIPAKSLSETFKEYHLHFGIQRGGYRNP
jgi:hypothetical protein